MTGACTVCTLPPDVRTAVDAALATGEPVRHLAARFVTPWGDKLGRMSLQRHKDGHLPGALLQAAAEADVRAALDVVQQLKAANDAAWAVLQRAEREGHDVLVLGAIDRVQRHIELVVRLREAADAAALDERLAGLEARLAAAGATPVGIRALGAPR